jgi:hypothetical protein
VDFDWGTGSPGPAIPTDGFSARWITTRTFTTGLWTFTTTSDDGIRLWVDDTLVIDNWTDQTSPSTDQATIFLQGGPHTITVEYYENAGSATAEASWRPTLGLIVPLM